MGCKSGADLHTSIGEVDDWLFSTSKGESHGGYTLRLLDALT